MSNTMLAVCTIGDGNAELRRTAIPTPARHEFLVKVAAAAQNPTDWKTANTHKTDNTIVGCDFAGEITAAGPNAPTSFKVGDRVSGFIHGGIHPNGAFAEYAVCSENSLILLPDSWSFEDGAQLGLAGYTSYQCLFQSLKLPVTDKDRTPVLIWGGSTSVGHFAIQMAREAGLRVLTTASASKFEAVTALGAEKVFDYKDHRAGERINEYTNGQLKHVIDCIGERSTPYQTSRSTNGGTVAVLQPYVSRQKGVQTISALAYALIGEPFDFPIKYTPSANDIQMGREAGAHISKLLAAGKIVPMKKKLYSQGLASVVEGLNYMKQGYVSGEKIVYRVADTPGL